MRSVPSTAGVSAKASLLLVRGQQHPHSYPNGVIRAVNFQSNFLTVHPGRPLSRALSGGPALPTALLTLLCRSRRSPGCSLSMTRSRPSFPQHSVCSSTCPLGIATSRPTGAAELPGNRVGFCFVLFLLLFIPGWLHLHGRRVTQSALEATSKGNYVPQAGMSSGPIPHSGENKNKNSQGLKTLTFRTHISGVMFLRFIEVARKTEGRKAR